VYGPRYDSGQVRLGTSRGNRDLHCDDVDSGISQVGKLKITIIKFILRNYNFIKIMKILQVESGIVLTAGEDNILRQLSSRELPYGQGWDQNFHVYRADWTAGMKFCEINQF